jgi:hypothetical protein
LALFGTFRAKVAPDALAEKNVDLGKILIAGVDAPP